MVAHDAAVWGTSDWSEADLREHWAELELGRDARVVEDDDGRIVGYVDAEVRGGRVIVDGYVDPSRRGQGVGATLIEWGGGRAAAELEHTAGRVYVHYVTIDRGAGPLLEARGYELVRHNWRMLAELAEEPRVVVPDGVEIRPYRAEEERAIHAAMEEAWSVGGWQYQPRTYEQWAPLTLERPGHDPTLCFVALADGDIVGAALSDWKRNGDWGWIGSLGVRPAWRRRGIAEALLLRSFAEFYRRGERRVALGVDAENPTGATRLYEKVGMRVLYEIEIYEKELRAGTV